MDGKIDLDLNITIQIANRGILSAMEDLAQQNHQDPSWGQYKATVILILLCESEV